MLRVELSGLHDETRLSSQGIEAGVGFLVEGVRCAELEPPALALARKDPPLLRKNDPGLEQVFSAGGE